MYSPTSRDNVLPWPESGVLMLFHPLHPFKEVSKVPTWMCEQLNTAVCEQVRLFRECHQPSQAGGTEAATSLGKSRIAFVHIRSTWISSPYYHNHKLRLFRVLLIKVIQYRYWIRVPACYHPRHLFELFDPKSD